MLTKGRWAVWAVFLITVFLSAFLLFQVQPLISKFILPWFGGSPAVWTTCMLFFQVVLFAGYFYAHLVTNRLPPKWQIYLHVALMLAAIFVLPIAPDAAWKPGDPGNPSGRIIGLLLACVGLPYFVLSTTGPLIQRWFANVMPGRSPYRLYALSNAGSLLALLTYPFVFESRLSVETQATLWSYGFAAFVLLCSGCAFMTTRSLPFVGDSGPTLAVAQDSARGAPAGSVVLLWIGLAATASAMLLAVTNQVCTDIAVVPFLWVVPLALYLLSFILCFDSDRWYSRRVFGTGLFVASAAACFALWDSAMYWLLLPSLIAQAGIYFGLLFCACMVCHGELVKLKPHPQHLTTFYLSLSAGGALGGVFVALVAPQVFQTLFELPLAILASCLLLVTAVVRDPQSSLYGFRSIGTCAGLASIIMTLAVLLWMQAEQVTRGAVATARNFYGVIRVHATNSAHVLRHGQIRHGHQFLDPDRRQWATTYYGPNSGCGITLSQHRPGLSQRVGIIGLGAGTLATYARSGDYYRIYEINPAVVAMAEEYFTYLPECRGEWDVVTGDGRIALELDQPQNLDVLILDAFSGDAIPTHLLTRECGAVYLRHLKSDGILAWHITNRHLDLRPVCRGLADQFGLFTRAILDRRDRERGTITSTWVLMSRTREVLESLRLTESREVSLGAESILWTDASSNLFSVLRTNNATYDSANFGQPTIASN